MHSVHAPGSNQTLWKKLACTGPELVFAASMRRYALRNMSA
jgi:hypothetical protein